MKSELDSLMQTNGIAGMLVTGAGVHNPALQYFTGGAHLSEATLVKPVNRPAVLYHISMERDEAAATGLETCDTATVSNKELLVRAGGDRGLAEALRFQWMLHSAGIDQGQVAIYGAGDIGKSFTVFSRLEQAAPDLTLIGFQENDFLSQAMMTKDAGEVERIRRMGVITTTVVGRVADFLSSRPVSGGILLGKDDRPLTIGEVKVLINLWLAELGAENPEGTIFSMGRDSAVPHSSGTANAILKLGETIVFDIYPCEQGGGYFYDFTRTWCLGYAPDEVLKLHEDVLAVYNRITEGLRLNEWFGKYQRQACELFEAQGHPTVLSNPRTERGYVHGLGHGVGLKVQERPHSGAATHPSDLLLPGVVVTIEPGLYYPEKGMGMRLENTLYAREDGSFEILADFPMDLILPVKISA